MYECKRCNINCHILKLPFWGNCCLANIIDGECFEEYEKYEKYEKYEEYEKYEKYEKTEELY